MLSAVKISTSIAPKDSRLLIEKETKLGVVLDVSVCEQVSK